MAAKVTLNSGGMAELLKSAAVIAELEARAAKVLAAAQATAPVASGAYKAGLHLEMVIHPSRAVVRVIGGTDHDWIVEARTGNLARALDAGR